MGEYKGDVLVTGNRVLRTGYLVLDQRQQLVGGRCGEGFVVDVAIKLNQLHLTADVASNPIEQRGPRLRIIERLSFAVNRRYALERQQDCSWSCGRRNL